MTSEALLTSILEMCQRPLEVRAVEVPEWKTTVYLTSMSGTSRDKFDEKVSSADRGGSLAGIRAFIVGACLCDKDGVRLNPTAAQLQQLGEAPATILETLFDAARDVSGLSDSSIKDSEGNYASETSDDTG